MTNTLINRQWVEANPDKALAVIEDLADILRTMLKHKGLGHNGCLEMAMYGLKSNGFTTDGLVVNTPNKPDSK